MDASTAKPEWRADALVIFIIVALGLFYSLWGAAHATDRAFASQMWTAFAAFIAAGGMLTFVIGRGARPNETPSRYENGVVKAGVFASMFWGIAGFLVGVVIALQLAFPNLFYFPEFGWTNFRRLRPLHTNGGRERRTV